MKKHEQILRDIWHTIRETNVYIIKIPGEDIEKGTERIFEEIIAKLPKFYERYEATLPRSSKNSKQYELKETYKLLKVKDKKTILKAMREK